MNHLPAPPRPPRTSRLLTALPVVLLTALLSGFLSPTITADQAVAATTPELTDSFNGARDAAPTYGLNDTLGSRQTGTARGSTYTRVHGDYTTPAATPPSNSSQVNNSGFAGMLSFWIRNSAVRLDAPVTTDATDSYTVTATANPNANALGGAGDWVSFILSNSNGSTGYVTATTADLGLTVARSGDVMLYRKGVALWGSVLTATRQSTGFAVSITVSAATSSNPTVSVTVNGATRTAALGVAVPRPYLYLGAYISNGSATAPYKEVSTVDNLTVSKVAHFADTFDGADSAASDHGLNNTLASRQSAQANLTYTRVPGTWDSTATPPATYSQVNNGSFPNKLSFWVANSAVKLDAPVAPDNTDAFEVRATVDPDPGQFGSAGGGDWVSLMLSQSATESGYITDAQNKFGMTVRRNGIIEFYKNGASFGSPITAQRSSSGFAVTVRVTNASTSNPTVSVTVNGVSTSLALGTTVSKPYLYLGAYISNGSATAPYKEVSTIDSLSVSRVDPFPYLQYFGTYGTRNDDDAGNHIPDMTGISNQHWINVAPTTNQTGTITYRTDVFASCPPKSCIVYVGNEFFAPIGAAPEPNLNRWNQFVAMLQPYKDKILAYYLKDEPYLYGVTPAQLDWSAKAVRASINAGTIPAQPIMLTLTLHDIDTWASVPTDVDWLGMDHYTMDAAQIERSALRLDEMALGATDRTYMFPPNVPDVWNGFTTEQQILTKQYEYLQVANRHPKMIALLNFGLWVNTGAAGSTVQNQEYVPNVFALQERIGTAISVKK